MTPAARNPGRFLLGAAVETLFSILIAPILMLTQTSAVLEILRGKDAGWSVQRRHGEAPPFDEVVRFHKWHVLIGVALAVTCSLVSLYVFAWMAPIVLGQLLAVGLSVVTSRVTTSLDQSSAGHGRGHPTTANHPGCKRTTCRLGSPSRRGGRAVRTAIRRAHPHEFTSRRLG